MDGYDRWNKQKKKLQESDRKRFFNEGEVWWCVLGLNVGHEQNGSGARFLRPVLIIKVFQNGTALVLPITTTKRNNKFYYSLKHKDLRCNSKVILSQIRTLDQGRFVEKIVLVEDIDFLKIKSAIIKINLKQ